MFTSGSSDSEPASTEASPEIETREFAPSEQAPTTELGNEVRDSYLDCTGPFPKSPEHGKEGLVVLWEPAYKDASTPSLFPVMVPDFDIVVIHGLHGARRSPWSSPGSGDSSWLADAGTLDGRKVMSFGYDATKILAGNQTRQAIRKAATRLLDDLIVERQRLSTKRPIMFISHDVGGIILKDALTFAGHHPRTYGNIFDYTRVLIFYGCPHRARSFMDMEDRLSRFIFCHAQEDNPTVAAAVSSIRGLASAVVNINNLFIDLKSIMRSYIVSIFCGQKQSLIDPAMNSFAGTLAMPFEIRLAGGVSHIDDGVVIEKHLLRIQFQIVPNPETIPHERTLLCIAAPPPFLATADEPDHAFAWVGQNEIYTSWYNQKRPQLLYVHGTTGAREASEYIFYDLDRIHLKRNNEIVLYFRFNRWDVRRDSVQDMLTCFLAQIIGHFPSLAEFVTGQFERLSLDRSWTDFDLLNWFEYYRLRGEIDGISCVIANFDECDPVSRKAFLELFGYIARIHERPWRVVVTSKMHGALLDDLHEYEWPSLDLDAVHPPPSTVMTAEFSERRPEVFDIVQRRPERRNFMDRLEEELGSIDSLHPVAKHVVLEHMCAQDCWPEKESIKTLLGDVATMSLAEIVNKILKRAPDKQFAFRAFSWILYANRPPTIWEMACVMIDKSNPERFFPPRDLVFEIKDKIITSLAGVVVIEQHEFHIPSSRLRIMLLAKHDPKAGPRYPWHDFGTTAHGEIAKVCLEYLAQDEVIKHVESVYCDGRNGVIDLPTSCDRTNLCDYTLQFWTHHLSACPNTTEASRYLKTFMDSKAVPSWLRAHWAVANPIKRSPADLPVYPLLAGVGMADLAEPWRDGDTDIAIGLIESCLNGYPKVFHDLLPREEHSVKTLQDALVAAGSNGNEKMWLDLINHVAGKYKDFPWPTSLVNRAAFVGFEQVVARLLGLGVPVDPEDSIQGATPLHLVSRTGFSRVAQILLEYKANVKHLGQNSRTPLHLTASFGHPNVARLLAKAGVDLNAKDDERMTAIYMGCLWGNFTVVRTLMELGADPNITDSDNPSDPGWSPLVVAAEEKHLECARALLEGGADPNIRGVGGTPLRYAANNGLPDMCRLLVEKGADPNHSSIDPPILYQVVTSHDNDHKFEVIKVLVENHARINVAQSDGSTALFWACFSDDEDMLPIISYLLEHGADVNQKDQNGLTPLHMAVRRKNVDTVRILLNHKADFNSVSGHRSVLSWAVESEEITRLLLEKGADPNQHTAEQNSPLMWAVLGEHTAAVKLLLEHKAAVETTADVTDAHDWTALSLAAAWGYVDILRLLADAGADVNYRMKTGRTPTHAAFTAGNDTTLPALLEHRPDVNIQDDKGNAPLHEMTPFTPVDLVQLLVRARADVELQDKNGVTPLGRACQEGNSPAALYLLSRGARVDVASDLCGTPLHMACSKRTPIIKELIAAGADVNSPNRGTAGTPLQTLLMECRPEDWEVVDPLVEEIMNTLFLHGADATSAGGRFGSSTTMAAWKAPLPVLSSLIGRGARATLADPMGRQPIHFAAARGLRFLNTVLDAGGDAAARDKAGRTPLHWAAQGGNLEVLEKVLTLTGDEVINQPDVSGWTPLCWVARGCGLCDPLSDEIQTEMVKELLKRGADKEVKVADKAGEAAAWTPWAIAKYHSASEAVLELLVSDAQRREEGASKKPAEIERKDSAHGVKRVHHHKEQGLRGWSVYCDYCVYEIHGLKYTCKTCSRFDFCYKCYQVRDYFHADDHVFDIAGPELEDLSETSDTSSVKSSSVASTSSTSDSDEDDNSPST